MPCEVCGDPKTAAKGRCRTCYEFWRRRGRDRPPGLVERLTEKDIERELERRRRD